MICVVFGLHLYDVPFKYSPLVMMVGVVFHMKLLADVRRTLQTDA